MTREDQQSKSSSVPQQATQPDQGTAPIPNVVLSRTARTGEATEDELLLQRPRHPKPVPRVPEQAEFTQKDPWRVLRIMGEYVHGFGALAEVGVAIAIFGSAGRPQLIQCTRQPVPLAVAWPRTGLP